MGCLAGPRRAGGGARAGPGRDERQAEEGGRERDAPAGPALPRPCRPSAVTMGGVREQLSPG